MALSLKPKASLQQQEIAKGLNLVIKDGLATEAMTTLTGGTFLTALAVFLGASNMQIGILAALPSFTPVFQLLSIWLLQRYNNRRMITVIASFFARMPLFIIGLLPFLFSSTTSIGVLSFLLFFHYMFSSVAGAGWNSWMKDLVPVESLGTYFSRRSRLLQILNVTLSLALALGMDYVKDHYASYQFMAYALMFIVGGLMGMLGLIALAKTPEPQSYLSKENIFKLFALPLKDNNFRKLLTFNSAWSFAINIATPFFAVYMIRGLGLPLSYIIALTIVSQLSSIAFIKLWGQFSDRFSNKTIISICAPLFIFCLTLWGLSGFIADKQTVMILLVVIHLFTGIANAGINLSLSNIVFKLAPKDNAVVFISARNMIVAAVTSIAPLLAGFIADAVTGFDLIGHMKPSNILFLLAIPLSLFALKLLKRVSEAGETEKNIAVVAIRSAIKRNLKAKRLATLRYIRPSLFNHSRKAA